jgi:hypothetical protein
MERNHKFFLYTLTDFSGFSTISLQGAIYLFLFPILVTKDFFELNMNANL